MTTPASGSSEDLHLRGQCFLYFVGGVGPRSVEWWRQQQLESESDRERERKSTNFSSALEQFCAKERQAKLPQLLLLPGE